MIQALSDNIIIKKDDSQIVHLKENFMKRLKALKKVINI